MCRTDCFNSAKSMRKWQERSLESGGAHRKFWKYQDPVLWAWLDMFFTPEKYQFLNNTLATVIFVRLNTLKDTTKSPDVDLGRKIKRVFFRPLKGKMSSPFLFIWEPPPPPPPGKILPYFTVQSDNPVLMLFQIAEGDICRGLRIPIYMIFPRLFTCPTLATANFKIG